MAHVILEGWIVLLFDQSSLFPHCRRQSINYFLDVLGIRKHLEDSESWIRKHVILLNLLPFEDPVEYFLPAKQLLLSRLGLHRVVDGVSPYCLLASGPSARWIILLSLKNRIPKQWWRVVWWPKLLLFLVVGLTLVTAPICSHRFSSKILSPSTSEARMKRLLAPHWGLTALIFGVPKGDYGVQLFNLNYSRAFFYVLLSSPTFT